MLTLDIDLDALNQLHDRQRQAIESTVLKKCTLAVAAKRMGISTSCVSQLRKKGLHRLKNNAINPVECVETGQGIPTKTERKILLLIAQGLSTKEIARERKCSYRTVDSHIHNLFQKAGLHGCANRPRLIAWAIENGYCPPFESEKTRKTSDEIQRLKALVLSEIAVGIDESHHRIKNLIATQLAEQLADAKSALLKQADRHLDRILQS